MTPYRRKEQALILRRSTVAFGVLLAAFVISALYQLYRATLMEVPEYDAFAVKRAPPT
jgi:hypothetical protein